MASQIQANAEPASTSQEDEEARASRSLANAVIDIDGKRYRFVELLRPLIEKAGG